MTHSSHIEAQAILARIAKEHITFFYHFTSIENLPLICVHQALYSKQVQENEGCWPPPVPGGDPLSHSLDHHNGNWDKVSLSFTPFTPMAYHRKRKSHLCFFLVKPAVAAWEKVIFTDSNAAGTTAQRRGEGIAGINLVSFETIRSRPRPWEREGWKRLVQAEILVPGLIPLSSVSKIAFVSKASLQHAEQLCGTMQHPPFVVEANIFADSQQATAGTIGFSYIDQIALDTTKIDSPMVYLPHIQRNIYSKSFQKILYLTISIRALAGTQVNIYLHPISRQKVTQDCIRNTEFSRVGRYVMQTEIRLDSLPVSEYLVEVSLDNICRASIIFELQV